MHELKNKIDVGSGADKQFHALVFVTLSPEAYRNPEQIADILAKFAEVESIDIVAGKWELILKVRTLGKDSFYDFLKKIAQKENGIEKTSCIVSLKQVKPICQACAQKGQLALR